MLLPLRMLLLKGTALGYHEHPDFNRISVIRHEPFR